MRISHVEIKNFKSIKELHMDVQPLQALIGENNSGKSNILDALDLFLSGSTKNVSEDYYNDPKTSIEVKVTFSQLAEWELDRFRKYLAGGNLTITLTVTWDAEAGKPAGDEYHGIIREPKAEHLKESRLDDWSADDLQKFITEYGLPDYFLGSRGKPTKTSYRNALSRYLRENPDTELEPPEQATTQTLGWRNVLTGNLPEYFLLPAVRDFTDEEKLTGTTSLGRLVTEITNRIIESDPKIKQVQERILEVQKILNVPDKGEDVRPAELVTFERDLTDLLRQSMPSINKVTIQVVLQEIKDVLQSGVRLFVDDGIPTPVTGKGHGLQRAMIFAILRAYTKQFKALPTEDESVKAGMEQSQRRKTLVLAAEEPELYLHPQSQRTLLEMMRALSKEDQLLYCTHSTFFVDLADHSSIAIVSKKDLATGTKVHQYTQEIFIQDTEKKKFKMLTECDPERSELFFARKVVLLEGRADKVSTQRIAEQLSLRGRFDEESISLIDCGSKHNIPFFMKILNAFRIPYVVIHDVDPTKPEEQTWNRLIAQTRDPEIGRVVQMNPNLEGEAGRPGTHFKPWDAYQYFGDPKNVNGSMKELVESLFT